MSIHRYKKTETEAKWCSECGEPHTKCSGFWMLLKDAGDTAIFICDNCLAAAKKFLIIKDGKPTNPEFARKRKVGK